MAAISYPPWGGPGKRETPEEKKRRVLGPQWPTSQPRQLPRFGPGGTEPTYYGGPAAPWGGGGGGGGGGPAGPTPWTGEIGWGGVPWQTWEGTPWANVPKGKSQEAQAWFNVMLPWMQQQLQEKQWGTEFDWRKAVDQWQQGFQESQFGWQQEADKWAQGFQESQLAQEREGQNLAVFGRRWKPSTRWM